MMAAGTVVPDRVTDHCSTRSGQICCVTPVIVSRAT